MQKREISPSHEPDRGCVVLDQPQRVNRSRTLRLVFDTAALLWVLVLNFAPGWREAKPNLVFRCPKTGGVPHQWIQSDLTLTTV
jgi:hypothetical protein